MEIQKGKWSEIISPRANLLDLKLKEVWQYRDLLVLFVRRDFVATYKQTILGPVWHLIQPILTTIMFLLLFSKIAKIPTDGLPPTLFYMSGITIWNYFSTCFTATSATFVANASIFGKVYFPRLVLPISIVLSNMIKFLIQLGLLVIAMIFFAAKGSFHFSIGIHYLFIPVWVFMMAIYGLSFGIIISSLTTKYRDFTVLISFGIQLLMYVTPVAYPLSYLKSTGLYSFVRWNPLSPVVEGFRYAMFGVGEFDWGMCWYAIVVMIVSLFLGVMMFNKVERSFMDTV